MKSIYGNSSACVLVNKNCTERFDITSGVKQGDVLFPTLFSMFPNDLAICIKDLGCGVNLENSEICILLYADDIVLLAPDESSLWAVVNFVSSWRPSH